MGFFHKLKKGASEAGEKAKIMIEINKLKVQISQAQKELQDEFRKIGEIAFELHKQGNFDEFPKLIEDSCNDCLKKQKEIEELELKIKEINDEKKCPNCNKAVDSDIKFCSACGYKFEIPNEKKELQAYEEEFDDIKLCNKCNAELDKNSKFCSDCGEETN